jgi:hypothetical protein
MTKTPADIRSLARSYTEDALKTLAEVMRKEDATPAARVSAANAILERAYGRPSQPETDSANEQRDISELSTPQLLARLAALLDDVEKRDRGQGEGEAGAPDICECDRDSGSTIAR